MNLNIKSKLVKLYKIWKFIKTNVFVVLRNKIINPRYDSKFFNQKVIAGNYLPSKDSSFAKWIDSAGNYQYEQIYKAIQLDNSKREVALDIGANVGIITRVLGENYKFVVALEPSAQNRAAIYRNQTKELNNLIIYPFAASSENGEMEIRISDESCGGNSLSDIDLPNPNRFEKIHLVKIDEIICENSFFNDKQINLIKIDIQGYELQALKGAIKTIKKHKPLILCEVMTSFYSNEEKINEFLGSLGYKTVDYLDKDRIYQFSIK